MFSVRICVEWIFKEVKMQFTVVDFKFEIKLIESPIGLMFLCCMFLSSCRNYIYPNQISQYFNCRPPTLENYLRLSLRKASCSLSSATRARSLFSNAHQMLPLLLAYRYSFASDVSPFPADLRSPSLSPSLLPLLL